MRLTPPAKGWDAIRPVLADHGRVVQIIDNLLSNAIKYTPEGGRIEVAACVGTGEAAGSVVISVKDNGCGIAHEDRERIFQKFNPGAGQGRRLEGVGLGLSIVRELVSMHRGQLWLESEVGKGSAFSFNLLVAERRKAGPSPDRGQASPRPVKERRKMTQG